MHRKTACQPKGHVYLVNWLDYSEFDTSIDEKTTRNRPREGDPRLTSLSGRLDSRQGGQ